MFMRDQLAHYRKLWRLSADGESFISYSGLLQPVAYNSLPCMLKIGRGEKDERSNMLMAWWNGTGAAPVLHHDNTAILMERALGRQSLTEMVKNGQDDEASRIICQAVAKLHAHSGPYPGYLIPLNERFRSLRIAVEQHSGLFEQCLKIAEQLLSDQKEVVALHGDIHHGNILDFGQKGWLAIDPKGLIGERGFDR
jgi:streptomycin 6-kinase